MWAEEGKGLLDVEGRRREIMFGEGVIGGEATFVARDSAAMLRGDCAEDDGFLVVYVTDTKGSNDADDMESFCMVRSQATPLFVSFVCARAVDPREEVLTTPAPVESDTVCQLASHRKLARLTWQHMRLMWVMVQVYDAQSMSSEPLAKVRMPQRVPLGLHGAFVSSEMLAQQADAGQLMHGDYAGAP